MAFQSNRPGIQCSFDNSKTALHFQAGDTTIYLPDSNMSKEERAKKESIKFWFKCLYREAFPIHEKANAIRKSRFVPISRGRGLHRHAIGRRLTWTRAWSAIPVRGNHWATANFNVIRSEELPFAGKQTAMEITPAQIDFWVFDWRAMSESWLREPTQWLDLKAMREFLVDASKNTIRKVAPTIQTSTSWDLIPQIRLTNWRLERRPFLKTQDINRLQIDLDLH